MARRLSPRPRPSSHPKASTPVSTSSHRQVRLERTSSLASRTTNSRLPRATLLSPVTLPSSLATLLSSLVTSRSLAMPRSPVTLPSPAMPRSLATRPSLATLPRATLP